MSEYWVSNKKHYCKVCKVWIADNVPSRRLHETGQKHKDAVERQGREKREARLEGFRNEAELDKEMKEMERAASEAVRKDHMENPGLFRPSLPSSTSQHMAIAQHVLEDQHARDAWAARKNASGQPSSSFGGARVSENDSEDSIEKDSTGIYTIGDQTYLEAAVHYGCMVEGVEVEIFLEEVDDWLPGVILGRQESHVPHTKLIIRTWAVQYVLPCPGGSSVEARELEVKEDRLRMLATPAGRRLQEVEEASVAAAEAAARVDQDTGLGMWKTVSEREITDAEAEEERRLAAEREAEAVRQERINRDKALRSSGASGTRGKRVHQASDDVLATFNPKESNMYKGFAIVPIESDKEEINLANGKSVGFKKRKGSGTSNRNTRIKSEDG